MSEKRVVYIYELQAVFSENNNKGTCELNEYNISPLDPESTDLSDQHGVIFSMFSKVTFF